MEMVGAPVIVEGVTEPPGAEAARRVGMIWAGPGYFDVLGIPILFGRAVDERDRRDTPRVAVVSETLARQYFGSGNVASAVGCRFRLERDPDANAWFEVVGVARDTRAALVDPRPQVFYRSVTQLDLPPTTVLARTSLDAAALVGAMQRELRAVNATLPVISAKTLPASGFMRWWRLAYPGDRTKSGFAWLSVRDASRWCRRWPATSPFLSASASVSGSASGWWRSSRCVA
jgi:hypothetical protein